MIHDRAAVARDVVARSQEAAAKFGAETVIMGCTIIAAIYQEYLMAGGEPSPVPILNPNLLALKMAEGLADLHCKGGDSRTQRLLHEADRAFRDRVPSCAVGLERDKARFQLIRGGGGAARPRWPHTPPFLRPQAAPASARCRHAQPDWPRGAVTAPWKRAVMGIPGVRGWQETSM